jgi:hypothetical protein
MLTVIRGTDRKFRVFLKHQSTQEPVDLTACTSLEALFVDEDGAIQKRTEANGQITYANKAAGLFDVKIDRAFTATLKIAERQTFQIEAVVGGDTFRVNFIEMLTVEAKLEDD